MQARATNQTIYTFGYSGSAPADILAYVELLQAMLVDVRYVAKSRIPAWTGQALRELVGTNRYMRVRELGNVNYKSDDAPIQLADPAAAIMPLMTVLERGPAILVCVCREWQTCHRLVAAEYIQQQIGGEIVHLPSRFSEWQATRETAKP